MRPILSIFLDHCVSSILIKISYNLGPREKTTLSRAGIGCLLPFGRHLSAEMTHRTFFAAILFEAGLQDNNKSLE